METVERFRHEGVLGPPPGRARRARQWVQPRSDSTLAPDAVLGCRNIYTSAGCSGVQREAIMVGISVRNALVAPLLCALAVGTGCASQSKEAAGPPPSYKDSRTTTATATVTAVDLGTRMVTLRDVDGRSLTVQAGDQVRNLAQVQVGDRVKVEYTEAIVVDVVKADGSSPDAAAAAGAARAPLGDKPAGAVAQVTTVSASIMAIDRQTNRVTLRGPAGNDRVIQVKDPKKLENVAVGDMVYATYTESLAISVEQAK